MALLFFRLSPTLTIPNLNSMLLCHYYVLCTNLPVLFYLYCHTMDVAHEIDVFQILTLCSYRPLADLVKYHVARPSHKLRGASECSIKKKHLYLSLDNLKACRFYFYHPLRSQGKKTQSWTLEVEYLVLLKYLRRCGCAFTSFLRSC